MSLNTWGQDRYVSVSGSGDHSGTSLLNEWTILEAQSANTNGLTIHVRAGNYGNVNLTSFENDASWVGYNTIPGDVVTSNASTYSYPAPIINTFLPTFTGSNLSSGTGMYIDGNNVKVENFQFTNMSFAINWHGTGGIAKNLIGHTLGIQNGAEVYNGWGFRFNENGADIDNCIVVNAGAEGITLQGDNSTINNSHVYGDVAESDNGCDYYILITGGNNNVIENCTVNRFTETNAGRHGFVIKQNATGNLIQNCVANDINIEAQFTDVTGNTFRDIEINGSWSEGDGDVAARIRIANGANFNKFINIRLNDVYGAIAFADWDDGAASPGNAPIELGGGNNNYILNVVVNSAVFGIYFEEFQALTTADDNYIIHATFNNVDYLFADYMDNSGTKLINSIVNNVSSFENGATAGVNINTEFRHVNLSSSFNTSFLTPFLESDITIASPTFINLQGGVFEVSESFVNGENASLIIPEAAFDFNGNPRSNYTLGAYEFTGSGDNEQEKISMIQFNRILLSNK